jgi:hypothetical protein
MLNPPPPPRPTGRYEWERAVLDDLTPSTPTVKLVALTLATYSNGRTGGNVRPGIQRLAKVTGLSERTIIRSVKELEELGMVACVRRGSSLGRGGKGMASTYQLTVPVDLGAGADGTGDSSPDHVTPMSPDNGPEQVTLTPEQVTPATDHVTLTPDHVTPMSPYQPINNKIRNTMQQATPLTHHVRDLHLLAQDDGSSSAFDKARHHLGNLGPEKSERFMDQARAALGADAPLLDRVIHAAQLAGLVNAQEREAS